MRSLRLDDDLDARVQRAAAVQKVSVSEFIRSAAAERAAQVLQGDTAAALADVLGVVHSGTGRERPNDSKGAQARRTGEAFTEILVTKR